MGPLFVFVVLGMILIRIIIGHGEGESVFVSFAWGCVNVICAAAGGLLAVVICGRR
jgi:hypothetical protein